MKFGGTMHLTFSGGRRLTIRSDFEERLSGVSAETITNQDRSLDKTISLQPYGFSATFRIPDDLDLDALLLEEAIDATLVEEHTGRTILYTDGMFSGAPSGNRQSGAMTSLSFDCRQRREV